MPLPPEIPKTKNSNSGSSEINRNPTIRSNTFNYNPIPAGPDLAFSSFVNKRKPNKKGSKMKLNVYQKTVITALATVTLLTGCSKEVIHDRAPGSGKQYLASADDELWKKEKTQYTDTSLVLSKTLTDEGHKAVEKELRETSLNSLNLPSTLNVNAYTVRSKGSYMTRNIVYIAPKLFLYRKSDKARVQIKQIGENVLIPLQAILVDGFSKQIPAADGIETVPLPESYQVNYDLLKQALVERGFGENVAFGPLDGCPKSFSLNVAGDSYDITPRSLKDSNQCELNRPFTLNLIVPKEKADFIVNEALYFNEADVQASFEVMVGFVETDSHIMMDRSKIFEKLSAALSVQKPPYIKGAVQAHLKSIVQNEMMNVFIKGDRNDVVNQLIEAAYNSFIVPFELIADTSNVSTECKETAACVNITYEKNTETRNLEVSYQQYSTSLTGQVISSFAKGQQILFPEVVFQSETADGKNDYVSNLVQNERDLMITVNQGAVIEINFEKARHQIDYVTGDVKVNVSGGNRCGSYDFFKRCEWHEYWIDVGRNYTGPKFTEAYTPAGNLLGLASDEILLKFKSAQDETYTECSLSKLNAIGNGNHYVIKLENTSTCAPFKDELGKKNQYSVMIVNRLKDPNPLLVINNGSAFSINDRYSKQDGNPSYDANELGGTKTLAVSQKEREIQLSMKVTVRKYDISE